MEAFSRLALSNTLFAPLQEESDSDRKSLQLSLRPSTIDLRPAKSVPSPGLKLPFSFMSQMAMAGMGIQNPQEASAHPPQIKIQVDEALGVDKLRHEKRSLQEEVEKWKSKAEVLEQDLLKIENNEEFRQKQIEQERIAHVFRDIQWRQMGLLEGSHNRKRVHQHAGLGPGLRDIVPRDPQRRALEVAGKPYHMVKQARGSSDGPATFEEEWDAYADAQEHLNTLQQTFNETFTELSKQKAHVDAQHSKVMSLLGDQTNSLRLDSAQDQEEEIRDGLSQDESESSHYQMSPIAERDESHVSNDLRFHSSGPESEVQAHDVKNNARTSSDQDQKLEDRLADRENKTLDLRPHDSAPSSMESEFVRESMESERRHSVECTRTSSDVKWPEGFLHRTQSVGTPSKNGRPSVHLRSDSPRDLQAGNEEAQPERVGNLTKHLSYVNGSKWNLHGALSEEAQELSRIRSIQLEAERQRLWQSMGGDPEDIRRRIKDLNERESAQALKTMRLEARESLVADQEKLSEIALSRSMALDRREADLKAREEHLARTLSKHHARDEELKILRKRVTDLERLISIFGGQRPRRNSYSRSSTDRSGMNRSLSTGGDMRIVIKQREF